MPKIQIKRIYDDYHTNDGYRVLVDRLWPRGVKKEEAHLNEWCKELAPSTDLRQWYDHDQNKFPLFKDRYKEELKDKKDEITHILEISNKQKVTLLYAAKDPDNNHAIVLKDFLNSKM